MENRVKKIGSGALVDSALNTPISHNGRIGSEDTSVSSSPASSAETVDDAWFDNGNPWKLSKKKCEEYKRLVDSVVSTSVSIAGAAANATSSLAGKLGTTIKSVTGSDSSDSSSAIEPEGPYKPPLLPEQEVDIHDPYRFSVNVPGANKGDLKVLLRENKTYELSGGAPREPNGPLRKGNDDGIWSVNSDTPLRNRSAPNLELSSNDNTKFCDNTPTPIDNKNSLSTRILSFNVNKFYSYCLLGVDMNGQINYIREQNPDVICLQDMIPYTEGKTPPNDNFVALTELLKDYKSFITDTQYEKQDDTTSPYRMICNGIFVKKKNYVSQDILYKQSIQLGKQTILQMSTIKFSSYTLSYTLFILNVSLSSDLEIKLEQFTTIRDYAKYIVDTKFKLINGPKFIILTGDFGIPYPAPETYKVDKTPLNLNDDPLGKIYTEKNFTPTMREIYGISKIIPDDETDVNKNISDIINLRNELPNPQNSIITNVIINVWKEKIKEEHIKWGTEPEQEVKSEKNIKNLLLQLKVFMNEVDINDFTDSLSKNVVIILKQKLISLDNDEHIQYIKDRIHDLSPNSAEIDGAEIDRLKNIPQSKKVLSKIDIITRNKKYISPLDDWNYVSPNSDVKLHQYFLTFLDSKMYTISDTYTVLKTPIGNLGTFPIVYDFSIITKPASSMDKLGRRITRSFKMPSTGIFTRRAQPAASVDSSQGSELGDSRFSLDDSLRGSESGASLVTQGSELGDSRFSLDSLQGSESGDSQFSLDSSQGSESGASLVAQGSESGVSRSSSTDSGPASSPTSLHTSLTRASTRAAYGENRARMTSERVAAAKQRAQDLQVLRGTLAKYNKGVIILTKKLRARTISPKETTDLQTYKKKVTELRTQIDSFASLPRGGRKTQKHKRTRKRRTRRFK